MAKELPYFKFNCSEWIGGDITLEDLQTQGLFINICALYWFKSGCLKTSEIKPRLKCKQATINLLFENGHMKQIFSGANGDESYVKISFLDEQFEERGHKSEINKLNGSKGGAPIGNKNAIKNNQTVILEQPKTTNIEEEKNKNRIEEEKKEIRTLAWFEKQIDEIFLETLKMNNKDKDISQAIKDSFAHLAADSHRLAIIDQAGCKKLVNTWLSNQRVNGKEKNQIKWKV